MTSPAPTSAVESTATDRPDRATLRLDPDRLFPSDPGVRSLARQFYESTRSLPIVSPHGHVDAGILAEDVGFRDAANLLITPDHYVTRLLHAHGVPLTALGHRDRVSGTPAADGRAIWRAFCERWNVFRGTPSRLWLESELVDVFGLDVIPDASTADELYDAITERLARPEFKPRALFDRFRIDVLATTDEPADDLSAHEILAADPDFHGRVLPTFRPDRYLDAGGPTWTEALDRLAASTGRDTRSYPGYLAALEERREYFSGTVRRPPTTGTRTHPAHDFRSTRRRPSSINWWPGPAARARSRRSAGTCSSRWCGCRARTAWCCNCIRACSGTTIARRSPRSGPTSDTTSPSRRSTPARCDPFSRRSATTRHSGWSPSPSTRRSGQRELAPLAGYFPALYVGVPWWFLDTPDAIVRFRSAVTDTVGFYKTSGFIDDTRAYCSIPARHDMSRRLEAGHLARLVSEGRLSEEEAPRWPSTSSTASRARCSGCERRHG